MTTEIDTNRARSPASAPAATQEKVARLSSTTSVNAPAVVDSSVGQTSGEETESSTNSAAAISPVSRIDLEQAVRQIQDFAQKISRDISFSVDESVDQTVITVSDTQTKEVIRRIPSEEVLQVARTLQELRDEATQAVGILLNASA